MRRLVSAFAAVAALAFAAEPPPAEKSAPPPAEDAIAVAKREFDAVKETRGTPAAQPGLDLPGLTTPELQMGGGNAAAAAARTSPGKPDLKKKSANWLVDGVMKDRDHASPSESGLALEPGSSAADKDSAGNPQLESARGDRRKPDEGRPAKPSDPALNPLTRFMVGWMTPQDFALLRPGLGGNAAADTAARGDPSLPALASNPGVADFGGKDFTSGIRGLSSQSGAPTAPRDNPFLQSFIPPSQPVMPATLPVLPSSPAGTPGAFVPPAEAPPARSVTPNLAKPSDDAKYFKQLKRF